MDKMEKVEIIDEVDDKEIVQQEVSFKSELFDWMDSLAVSLAIIVFLFSFVIMTVQVSGESMENTLHHKDRLITTNMFFEPKYKDIVIIERENDDPIIKRVIATEGQEVDIDEATGEVYVDGVKLQEDYIKENLDYRGDFEYPIVVPEGCIYALGDNRNNSLDSTELGAFDERQIMGKVLFRIYPFDNMLIK